MSARSARTAFSGVWLLLCGLASSVWGEKVLESHSGSGMIQDIRTALTELAEEGRAYLGRVAGEQTVVSVQKAFSQVLGVVAGSFAGGLNVLLKYISNLLETAGVHVNVPVDRVTPDGLIFVAKWVVLALIGYWLLSLILRLVASTLRRTLWLLKLAMAVGCFGLILSDHEASSETTAMRLAVLVFVCVLLGVGSGRGSSAADKTAHLEQQVKTLERRLREMEKRRRKEE
ncbi:voltage-gated monoatomic cation channel TMEM109 [Halichoeres trimaculatus]|uniref:voltage-gated monoatomic cation channel TMEM109 n=1 Tax=Halichoeres trimaculatus TaxID=147232 RepID=UPI003D9E187D